MTVKERSRIARDFLKQRIIQSIPQMAKDLDIPYGTLDNWISRHSNDLKIVKDGRSRKLEMNNRLYELTSKYKPISKEGRRKQSSRMKKSWKKRATNGKPADTTIEPEALSSEEFLAASEHIRKLGENLIFMADQLQKHEEKIIQIKSILFSE